MLWSRVLPPAILLKASFAGEIVPEIQDSASEAVLSLPRLMQVLLENGACSLCSSKGGAHLRHSSLCLAEAHSPRTGVSWGCQ